MSQDLRAIQVLREIQQVLEEMRNLLVLNYVDEKVQKRWTKKFK